MNEVVLLAQGVEVRYGDRTVLGPLTLELKREERLAILGANGAGKSTLLKALFGEVRLHQGTIKIMGEDVRFGDASSLSRRGCFYAPFGTDVYPDLTVGENLFLFANRERHEGNKDSLRLQNRMTELLQVLPALAAKLKVRAGRLSGGERRLLAVARAQLQKPWILLWDEPFSGLSRSILPEVQKLIVPVETGATIILAEQNISLANQTCTHAMVLQRGRTVFCGPTSTLPKRPQELFDLLHRPTSTDVSQLGGR